MATVSNLSQQTLRDIEWIVCQIIGENLGIDDVELDKLFIDYCDDILDLVTIVMATEEHFEIEISDRDAESFACGADIAKYLVTTLSEAQLTAGIEKEV